MTSPASIEIHIDVITARIDPITTWTLYFDAVTGLLRREMTTTETLLLPLQD